MIHLWYDICNFYKGREVNFDNIIVTKPWGSEYLCYRNNDVAIWLLEITNGHKTSMHCHPMKNTGFVVLEGHAELSFLRNSIPLNGLDKIHICKSRFHSTAAITDCKILEIETPEDKYDLVRLDDEYGREGKSYEGEKSYQAKNKNCVSISEPEINPKTLKIFNCNLDHFFINNDEIFFNNGNEENLYVVTSGGLISKKNEKVVWPGDVLDGKTLNILLRSFKFESKSSVLRVTK